MSDNIISFPTKAVRDWLIIERELLTQLSRNGFPESIHERICTRLKAFYEFCDPKIKFDLHLDTRVPAEAAVSLHSELGSKIGLALDDQLQAFTKRLVIERLNYEIDTCRELGLI